ncbi:dual specificity protein phosphatase CDC14AB-like [Vespa mandarinia]|uniref:dual specificity protein phosphatase CDC14AB-like n=1 Tax=Vespa mandarinia TaxID=7446 RepID=UPI00160B9B3D|nr:dual specificity protein phosphatase CDC14AB-like [Vespa mandarinia]
MDATSTIYDHPDVCNIAEYIKNKLYFATLKNERLEPRKTENINFFSIDNELVYNNFYNDFGPLNLACLYRYCYKVNKKLNNPINKHKQIVHYTSKSERKRANAAYLIASYAILYLNKTPKEAYKPLVLKNELVSFRLFQDASLGPSIYNIHLLDCLNAIYKAALFGLFNFDDFDLIEYEKYEQFQNGDLNWMIPQKLLAFVTPSTENKTIYHPPQYYINYFLNNGVVAVVRLNTKTYDSNSFTKAGISHYDMFMPDGTVPPKRILCKFLRLVETTNGAIAVHCKAGLGRTGSLIAAYLIKHYNMTAKEAIAWTRICRSGSVIGHQQAWLENIQYSLMNAGQQYRLKYRGESDMVLHHRRGIYSIVNKLENNKRDHLQIDYPNCDHRNKYPGSRDYCDLPTDKVDKSKLSQILGKLRNGTMNTNTASHDRKKILNKKDLIKCCWKLNDLNASSTQGDKLNKIKIIRGTNLRNMKSEVGNKNVFSVETATS